MEKVSEITSNAELEVGRYYHCFDRQTISHSVQICGRFKDSEPKYLGSNKIWADDENNQALERWRIFGPISPPDVGGMYLCNQHGGYGFQSDCQRCKLLSKSKEG